MDDKTIGRLVERLQAAWNAGDAAGWAACFADDADFIHVLGGHGAGRSAIEAAHRRLFETIYRDSAVAFAVEGIRPVGAAAVVRLYQTLRFTADGKDTTLTGRPSLVVAPAGRDARIVFFQNTLEQTPAALGAHPFAGKADGLVPVQGGKAARERSALGVTIRFLSSAGDQTIMEYSAPPGFRAAPPHVHASATEWFRVLGGTMRVLVGDSERDVAAGGFIEVPAGTVHTWGNASKDERLTFLFGFDRPGMDGYFERVVQIASQSPVWPPADPSILKNLAAEFDTFEPAATAA